MQIIELLPIKVESTLDWSLIAAIIGGVSYYFGKLIAEVKPMKEERYSNYVGGVVFVVLFIVFPIILLYTIFGSWRLPKLSSWWAIALQFILTYYLGLKLNVFNIERIKLKDYADKLVDNKTQEVYKKLHINKLKYNKDFINKVKDFFFYRKIPKIMLILFVVLEYWFTYSLIQPGTRLILSFLSILMLFVSLSIVAILHSWIQIKAYPKVIVYLDNGKKVEGELTKIEEGFINLIDGNKIYHINDSKFLYIEKNVLHKKK